MDATEDLVDGVAVFWDFYEGVGTCLCGFELKVFGKAFGGDDGGYVAEKGYCSVGGCKMVFCPCHSARQRIVAAVGLNTTRVCDKATKGEEMGFCSVVVATKILRASQLLVVR